MTDAAANIEEGPKKSGKSSLVIALILALAGAGGGFYAMTAGLIPIGTKAPESDMAGEKGNLKDGASGSGYSGSQMAGIGENSTAMEDIAFVELDPITISLNAGQSVTHLRFRAELEVNAAYEAEVSKVLPRVTDVMNGYLRALDLKDLTGPLALVRIRAQMLRRVQIVTGKGRVRDLLIMEFVLN